MYNPQLETFIRVADAGSFNKAAEQAYITPTAVIKQMNLLEDGLGVKLFERTHRGLHLTKAGISLYQDAKYIIGYCKDSVTRAKNAMQEDESVIRIGTSPMTPVITPSEGVFVCFRLKSVALAVTFAPISTKLFSSSKAVIESDPGNAFVSA